jgi:hypothetical protein
VFNGDTWSRNIEHVLAARLFDRETLRLFDG